MQKKSCPNGQDFFWQREKDSNPHIRSQSPLCYLYTIPLYCKRKGYYTQFPANVKRNRKFSLNFFYCFPRQSMDTLSPVRRKYKTPSRTGFSSSRVSAAA